MLNFFLFLGILNLKKNTFKLLILSLAFLIYSIREKSRMIFRVLCLLVEGINLFLGVMKVTQTIVTEEITKEFKTNVT